MTSQMPHGPLQPDAASAQAAGGPVPQQPYGPVGPAPYGPPAQPSRRSWFARHKILTGLGALVALVVVVQALGGGSGDESPQAGSDTPSVTRSQEARAASEGGQPEPQAGEPAQADQAGEGPAFAGKQAKDKAVQAGESLTADGVTITATPLTPGDATLGPTACSTITISNNSGSAIDVNAFDWSLQDPNGVINDVGFLGSDSILSASSIIDGGSLTADVCFDGQLGSGEYVLLYKPVFSWSGDRQAWINQR
ncbi:DUF4352 domain-containing protein [Actinomyces capricornis]|uniref:DUF4352 domain-containing protein n=1 Tax=Actinomyces capricornis TaxID=2755559 RepID=A0ABN6K3U7_9ACTO|nr:DUF4352 domain-containing protein [Actinomyces capricornis]BDA64033.1 hypothetical protein MANAM107_08670 [Actinomyces capricornis]